MDRAAVDVVLLPSSDIAEKAVELNRMLTVGDDPGIKLDLDSAVPHISLCMGVLKDRDTSFFWNFIEDIGRRYLPVRLQCSGIYSSPVPGNEIISGIAIEITGELRLLHKEIMTVGLKYLTYDAVKDDLFRPPEINDITPDIINEYPEKSAFDRFFPHITLGVGDIGSREFKTDFQVSAIAMYQLGNYCTCRKPIRKMNCP